MRPLLVLPRHCLMSSRKLFIAAAFIACLTIMLHYLAPAVPNARAAFPGDNGKIVFVRNYDIHVMNADGSGATNLTNHGAIDDSPAFSPDGSKIVFTSDRDGNVEIYSMNADGSAVTRLTTNGAWDAHPAWSPDSSKIAFQSDRAGGGNWEIYVMDANGANPTRLTNVAGNDSEPAWSPDGTKIAFTSYRDGNAEVYGMDTNGANQVNLTNNVAKDENPGWSPSGGLIAFSSRRSGNNEEIFVMSPDGSSPAQVTNEPFSAEYLPAFSPDGSSIAFVSNRDGNEEIYAIFGENPAQVNLTSNSDADSHPDWQPALAPPVKVAPGGLSGKIVFDSDKDGNWEIYAINPDGAGQERLTNNTSSDYLPAFSPDGARIAFASNRDGNDEIYVMNADGSNQTRLIDNGATDSYPAFSPDGSRIAFASNRDGNWEIYVMNADGTGQTRLTSIAAEDSSPSWSRDGTRIAFTSDRDGGFPQIYVMNANGSVPTRLTNNAGWDQKPAWSPDGSKIVFNSIRAGNTGLYSMNADGSGQTGLKSPWSDFNPVWSPEGNRIAYCGRTDYGNFWISVMDADDQNSATPILETNASVSSLDWQPLPAYNWTWYDDIGGSNWVLMANPATAARDLTFSLKVEGAQKDLTGYNNGVVAPGASITPKYPEVRGGPVQAVSTAGGRGIVSQRILWPKGGSSLEEVLGTDMRRLSSHFYWSWYDQASPGYKNWVLVSNPGAETVIAQISFRNQSDGQTVSATSDIAPGQSWSPTFPGKIGGPVEVKAYSQGGSFDNESDRRLVMASQRVLSNNGAAFNEAVGVPAEELSSNYYWPWYDDVYGRNWLLMANPNAAPVTYRIDIGGGCDGDGNWNGTPNTICQTGTMNGGDIITQRLGVINGPVHVYTLNGGSIIASQRVIFGPSFGETMGYPKSALAPTYHWTWYDQKSPGMKNWVLIANPSTSETIDVKVWLNGQQAQENVGVPTANPTVWTLAPGQRVTPRFGSYIGGPVEVKAHKTGTSSPATAGAIVSQRVLYNGFFNEVMGTVLD